MKITGGIHRGRSLEVPPGARPTGARVREALFSILGDSVRGSLFLDLFAGSGIVGLEALSRGAERVLLVERAGRALEALARNGRTVQETGWAVRAARIPEDLCRVEGSGRWNIVFADPPYDFCGWERLLAGAEALLERAGEFIVEHSARNELPGECGSLSLVDQRVYGESVLSFYRRTSSDPTSGSDSEA